MVHSESRNRLLKKQYERILDIKSREAGAAMTSLGTIGSGILAEWMEKNRNRLNKKQEQSLREREDRK